MAGAIETLNLSVSPAKIASENIVVETLRHLVHNKSAVAGMVIIGFFVILAVFSPQIATHDPILSMIGQPGETGKLPGKLPCVAFLGCTGAPQHIMGLDL